MPSENESDGFNTFEVPTGDPVVAADATALGVSNEHSGDQLEGQTSSMNQSGFFSRLNIFSRSSYLMKSIFRRSVEFSRIRTSFESTLNSQTLNENDKYLQLTQLIVEFVAFDEAKEISRWNSTLALSAFVGTCLGITGWSAGLWASPKPC